MKFEQPLLAELFRAVAITSRRWNMAQNDRMFPPRSASNTAPLIVEDVPPATSITKSIVSSFSMELTSVTSSVCELSIVKSRGLWMARTQILVILGDDGLLQRRFIMIS